MVGTSSIGSRSVVPAWELSPCQALTAQIPVPPFSIEPAQGSARRESAYPTPIDAISGRAQRAASLVRTATVRATLRPRLIAIKDETPPLPDQPRSRLEKALGAVTIVKGGEGIGALVLTLDSLVLPAACCRLMIVRELVILAGSGVEFTADSEAGQDVLLLFIVPMCGATASKVNRTQLIRAVALFFAPRSDDSQLPKPKRRARGCRVIPVGGHLRWAGHLGVPGLCQRPSLAQTGQVAAPADRPARALPSSSCLGGAAGRLCDDQPLTPRSIRWTTATSAPSTRPPRRSCSRPRAGGEAQGRDGRRHLLHATGRCHAGGLVFVGTTFSLSLTLIAVFNRVLTGSRRLATLWLHREFVRKTGTAVRQRRSWILSGSARKCMDKALIPGQYWSRA